MAQAMPPEQLQGFVELLEGLAQNDFANLPLEVRTELLHDVAASSHEARARGVGAARADIPVLLRPARRAGHNPNWEAIGYPGPISSPPSQEQAPKTIAIEK